jgi:hypothetical protein
VFFAMVASEPNRFPLRESLARSLKKKVRAAKGAAQPQSRSKRKAKRSQGQQKRDRVARREAVAQHNAALAAYEKERAEQEALIEYRRQQIQSEPKFNVTDIAGNVILEGVPASMVVAQEAPAQAFELEQAVAKGRAQRLILPPGVGSV